MSIKVLDTVVLERDLPDHGLKRGDIGAVVEVYAPDGVEILLSILFVSPQLC